MTSAPAPDSAVDALRNSQRHLSVCITLAPLSIAMFDQDMRYLAASARWIQDYGRGYSDLIGRSHYEVHPDLPDAWKDVHRRGLAGEVIKNDEDLWVQADGGKHWLRWSVTPWRDADGEIGGIIISTENITDRKRTEESLRASEEHFRALFEQATDGILVTDARGRFMDVNPSACQQLGYSRDELLKMNAADIVAPKEVERLAPEITRLVGASDGVLRTEWQLRRKDGTLFLGEVTSKKLPDGRLQALVRDITDTRRAQTQLQERQYFLQHVLDTEPGTVYIYDLVERRNTYVNRHWLTAYGYSLEETEAMGTDLVARLFSPDDQARIAAHHAAWRRANEGEIRDIEYHIRTKAGEWRWLHSRETPLARDAAGAVTQILGIAHDITERRHAEEALRESEQRLSSLIDNFPGLVYRCKNEPEWPIIFVSKGVVDLTGYAAKDFRDTPPVIQFGSLIHADDRDAVWNHIQLAITERRPYEINYRITHRDGQLKWCWERGVGAYSESGDLRFIEGYVVDVTERKEIELKLAASEALLRTIVDSEPACVKLIDADCRVLEMNAAGLDMIEADRREQVIGQDVAQLVVPEHRDAFVNLQRRVIGGASGTLEFDVVGLKGTCRTLETHAVPLRDTSGNVIAALGLTADITERKRVAAEKRLLERQLQQAQKMETIGRLAAGIAHDFNNILASVLGYSGLALERHVPDKNSELADCLREVQTAGTRARDLVANMLAFSRSGETADRRTVMLGPLAREVAKMLAPTIPSSIEFTTRIEVEGASVLANPVQMHQVIMNLVINARDAVGERGRIELAVRQSRGVTATCAGCQKNLAGDFVEIAVGDSGPGIPPDILTHIFEPFFTTKTAGAGTGMGLSVVHGVVHDCGGHVAVDSTPGSGTIMRVMLPLAGTAAALGAAIPAETTHAPAGGHILVVDDEDVLARLLGELLQSCGYRVAVFNDSRKALERFCAAPEDFDAVISDQTMPGLTGMDLTRSLRAIRPELPIILCTGFSATLNEDVAARLDVALLYKPIPFNSLFLTLEKLLCAARREDSNVTSR